ncbi:MAG: nucleoside triphosphate pyrophosphohydrolase [Thermoleophilia bacterium]|jgi:MazG family protein
MMDVDELGDSNNNCFLLLVYWNRVDDVGREVLEVLDGGRPVTIYVWDLALDQEGRLRESLASLDRADLLVERLTGPSALDMVVQTWRPDGWAEERGAVVLFGPERAREVKRYLSASASTTDAGRRPPVRLLPTDVDLRREVVVDALWRLYELTEQLRRECPWDRKQTQETIVAYTLEETYELVDTMRDRAHLGTEGDAAVCSELGDLLFQVYFIACVAEEQHLYDLGEVASGIHHKLVRRHPHVFGDVEAETSDDVLRNWNAIKKEAEGREGIFHEIPRSFPSLLLAQKLQQRAAAVGFDWERPVDVLAKFKEETAEIENELAAGDEQAVAAEVGDLLFAVVNLARKLKVDPELALRGSALRFRERVEEAVRIARREGRVFEDLELEEQESYYQYAKERLKR